MCATSQDENLVGLLVRRVQWENILPCCGHLEEGRDAGRDVHRAGWRDTEIEREIIEMVIQIDI